MRQVSVTMCVTPERGTRSGKEWTMSAIDDDAAAIVPAPVRAISHVSYGSPILTTSALTTSALTTAVEEGPAHRAG